LPNVQHLFVRFALFRLAFASYIQSVGFTTFEMKRKFTMKRTVLGIAAVIAIFGYAMHNGAYAQSQSEYQSSPNSPWADNYDQLKDFHSTKSRAEVKADVLAHRDEIQAITREDSGSALLASEFQSTKSRAEVTAEFLANREEAQALTSEDGGASYYARHQQHDNQVQLAGKNRASH
jgi:hypothetical protein